MGGGRVSGSRVSIPVAYLGGFFYCSNNWKNSSCQDNNGKWLWSSYHNNKKEPPFGLLDPPRNLTLFLVKKLTGLPSYILELFHVRKTIQIKNFKDE